MQNQREHDHVDSKHDHKAAPMVDEITDFEGSRDWPFANWRSRRALFTAEDHRAFTEWAESIGPAAGSRLVAKAWTDPAFKARRACRCRFCLPGNRLRLDRAYRLGHPKRLHAVAAYSKMRRRCIM